MKISVIVPVYNSEKYIGKCIESVLNQTYTDWELILINDGSTDSSSKIIDTFKDSRIKNIFQNNSGPGIARNNGITCASGDFLVFLDSDDYIDKDYFQLLVPYAKENDIVFIDVLQVDENGKVLQEEKMSKYKNWNIDRIIRSQMTGKIPWGGVRKAVSKKFITENKIEYTANSVGEEALYSFRMLENAKKIDFLDKKPVYYYVNHPGSQSKLELEDPWGEAVNLLEYYLKKNNKYIIYADTLNSFNITATIISIDRIVRQSKKDDRKIKLEERIKKFKKKFVIENGVSMCSK